MSYASYLPRRAGYPARLIGGAKLLLVAGIIAGTNPDVLERAQLLVSQGRIGTLGVFAAVWAIAIVATFVAAFEKSTASRAFWALMIALSSASAWGYRKVSGSELTVFDAVAFWDARHEGGNAVAVHGAAIWAGAILAVAAFAVFLFPVRRPASRGRLWRLSPVVPALPIILIAGIVYAKSGNGSQAMPKQFSHVSIGLLMAYKTVFHPAPVRAQPVWASDPDGAVRKIVMLVDESVRPDYLDPKGVTGETPQFAEVAQRLVDFGPAASGGICSSYANAILRFGAARRDLGGAINANPTLFAYAKRAGYRTVFIDAQAHTLKNTDLLQNFMTPAEKADIDGFYALAEATAATADRALEDIVVRELKTSGKVFIYANKQGAHFPYDRGYPAQAAIHHPTVTESGGSTYESNIASYRNALGWNVDNFFGSFFARADLADAALIYTSDHGQSLNPETLTHCVSDNADPRMALVPLFAFAGDRVLHEELKAGSQRSRFRASHFQIAPTLLAWMGYPANAIAERYGESLTAGPRGAPAFALGDIFGLFSSDVRWMEIDLSRDYLERPMATAAME